MSDQSKSDLTKRVLAAAAASNQAPAPKKQITFALGDEQPMHKSEGELSPLMAALAAATGQAKKGAPSLAFTESPLAGDNYLGLTKSKRKLIPDWVLKDIRVQDHLIAAILRTRGAHLSLFGHQRKDRFDIGFELELKKEFYEILTPEQFEVVTLRMKKFEQLLLNCGHTAGLEQQDHTTLASFLDVSVRNGLTFGRFATEIIYDRDAQADKDGKFPFNRFRARDVATIERSVRKGEAVGQDIRTQALNLLESLNGDKSGIDMTKLREDEYAWIQKIDGLVRSAFTHDEMLVTNLFESTDVEHNGYPVSPLDTVLSSVTTHISIDTYKRLYFQNGRATKGMLVINSDEVDESVLKGIQAQFNASINNVSNSFRTPIFGMGKEDTVNWLSMAGEGAQDHSFEFMSDQVARNILSAFSISPDELPGYAHLSRGTNSQTLSESSNEYTLTAARDTGIRPLLMKIQSFFNQSLLPLIDPLLAKLCELKFSGLDAQSEEQESTRLQQNMPTFMTYDETLVKVDKKPIGKAFGGGVPFNERLTLITDRTMNMGDVISHFMGDPAASVDPILRYKRDPFFLQYLQLLAQANPIAMQAYFAPRPHAMEFLMMDIDDTLEED